MSRALLLKHCLNMCFKDNNQKINMYVLNMHCQSVYKDCPAYLNGVSEAF